MSTLTATAAPVAEGWRPPPFCRLSWTSETTRAIWEPRIRAARDAIEDLALLRSADDGQPRIAFVRTESVERLCTLARACGVSLANAAPWSPGIHDVATGRSGRFPVVAAGEANAAVDGACEAGAEDDPVWCLAAATPGTEPFDDGRGMTVAGNWASNPLLAAMGLAAPIWPSSFACEDTRAQGDALLACAAAHGYEQAIGHLRDALSWPTSWTALHGVAEIKTPVFRFVRNTPPTRKRLSVHYLGTEMPEGAARGLGFPFVRRSRS